MSRRVAPSELDFSSLLPLGVQGQSRMRTFAPNNGNTFTAVNNVINIPLNSTGWLDSQHSYLNFNVALVGAGNLGFDGSTQSLIQTLRLIGSNGEVLEEIQNYNTVQAAFQDLQCSQNHTDSHLNAMERATTTTGVPTVTAAGNYDVSLKLMSALLNSGKYCPLGWLSGGGLSVELTLATNADCLTQTLPNNDATYSITNVRYAAQIVETSQDFNEAFTQMLQQQGGVQWHGVTPRVFNANFAGGTTETTVSVACRLKSIKSLFTILRPNNQFSINEATQCQRSLLGLNSYSVKVGSKTFPQAPLTKGTEFYAELVKSMMPLGDTRSANRMNFTRYNAAVYTDALAAGTVTQGFAGLDYETYAQSSGILESGIDTSSLALPITVEMKFAAATPAGNIRCTHVALCDCIFTLDAAGILSVST